MTAVFLILNLLFASVVAPQPAQDTMLTPDQAFILPLPNGTVALFTPTPDSGEIVLRRVLAPGRTTTEKSPDFVPGDQVLTVDGKPVESIAMFRERFDEISEGSPVEIVLLRDGKKLLFEVPKISMEAGFH